MDISIVDINTIIGVLIILIVIINMIITIRNKTQDNSSETVRRINDVQDKIKTDIINETRLSRQETCTTVNYSMSNNAKTLADTQKQIADVQNQRIAELITSIQSSQSRLKDDMKETNKIILDAQSKQFTLQDKCLGEIKTRLDEKLSHVENEFKKFTAENKDSLEGIRLSVRTSISELKEDNSKQLDKMRETVDEKLQKTLNDRITQSFKLVNDRLQEVYVGLGEMKTLANGVGNLQKILSNVKTRGILGELQLRAIMEQMLSKEQYEENVVTKESTRNKVEFAIKLPGDGNKPVYLPIDAKFPADAYHNLVDAYEHGNPDAIKKAYDTLKDRITNSAKDIHEKYIDPPNTTEFAIMFLPFEGLYAEVVRRGLVDTLQRKYKISIAGPTTFAALINSLQMGFKTLAIQKRSSEVWNVLGAVKTEFNTFATVLENAQKKIQETSVELDKLVGVRTRKINLKLREVSELPSGDTQQRLSNDNA